MLRLIAILIAVSISIVSCASLPNRRGQDDRIVSMYEMRADGLRRAGQFYEYFANQKYEKMWEMLSSQIQKDNHSKEHYVGDLKLHMGQESVKLLRTVIYDSKFRPGMTFLKVRSDFIITINGIAENYCSGTTWILQHDGQKGWDWYLGRDDFLLPEEECKTD